MAILARGSVTITDLHDATALSASIGASQMATQTYNNTSQTYTPNYATSPQVLTLFLTKAGSTTSLLGGNVSNVKWFKTVGTTKTEITSTKNTDTEYKSGTSNSVLTTKVNTPIAQNAVRWEVEGLWTDPATGLPVSFSASFDLNVVQLGKAAIIPSIYAPDGDSFRNNLPASLKINADLYKDGALSTGSKKFKWFASDPSLNTSQDADGGVGWRKITATSGTSGEYANSGFDVEVNSQGVLVVFPDAVINAQTYKVVITDNAGGTSGTKVTQYITLKDMDDPMIVICEGETLLKNGSGTVTQTARVWRSGQEIDAGGTQYEYRWFKYVNNEMVTNFGGTGINYKTGKSLVISNSDVNVKAEFRPEVHSK